MLKKTRVVILIFMKLSINWLKEYLTLNDVESHDIANKLTLHTCEVEECIPVREFLTKIIIVQVIAVKEHPDSDRLNIVSFDTGSATQEVVCGAPNVREGIKVPFASVGTTLPGGFTLSAKKIRGVLSQGMLCSQSELELGDDDDGLWELPADAVLGQMLGDYLQISNDSIIDINNKSLTHRPDLWGHYGMARELSCIYRTPLHALDTIAGNTLLQQSQGAAPIDVVVEKDTACLHFLGVSIDSAFVTTSPAWMIERLESAGMRSVNNIVDVSNYVMLELGIPNHIYDRKNISGNICVKNAGEQLKFATLDATERLIQNDDTMIFDESGAIGVAGIMGGKASAVQDDSTEFFIEVANWTDYKIRRTATRLALRTEASQRYEKALDSHLCETTLSRILTLLKETCPNIKAVGGLVGSNKETLPQPVFVDIRPDYIRKVLGADISDETMLETLQFLAFELAEKAQDATGMTSWKLQIPSFRATKDVAIEADIIEEIGRIYGYDNITAVSPVSDFRPVRLQTVSQMSREIRNFLVYNANSLEIMSYPLIGEPLLDNYAWDEKNENLRLANALNPETDRMRPSMIPSILQSVELNAKELEQFSLFEIGRIYNRSEGAPSEAEHLVFAQYSQQETPFLTVLNQMEKLLKSLRVPFKAAKNFSDNAFLPEAWQGLHPYEQSAFAIAGKLKSMVFSVHPSLLAQRKVKGYVTIGLLDLSGMNAKMSGVKPKYSKINRNPDAKFDCTVVLPSDGEAENLVLLLKKARIPFMQSVFVSDVYHDNHHQKSITLRSSLQAEDGTLNADELKKSEEMIMQTLIKQGHKVKSNRERA